MARERNVAYPHPHRSEWWRVVDGTHPVLVGAQRLPVTAYDVQSAPSPGGPWTGRWLGEANLADAIQHLEDYLAST